MDNEKWHKGSRFWLLGAQALWLSWLLVPLALLFRADATEEAMGAFGAVAFVLLGGGATYNYKHGHVQVGDGEG